MFVTFDTFQFSKPLPSNFSHSANIFFIFFMFDTFHFDKSQLKVLHL